MLCEISFIATKRRAVYAFGSAEKGQLGNGTTGERITTGNKTSYDIETVPGMFNLKLDAQN